MDTLDLHTHTLDVTVTSPLGATRVSSAFRARNCAIAAIAALTLSTSIIGSALLSTYTFAAASAVTGGADTVSFNQIMLILFQVTQHSFAIRGSTDSGIAAVTTLSISACPVTTIRIESWLTNGHLLGPDIKYVSK